MSENNPTIFTKDGITLSRRPSFKTANRTYFVVLESEYFSTMRIGAQHRKYLSDLRPGLLVSVSFFGQPVPVITVDDGVVRLIKIELGGVEMLGAATISRVLGITEMRQPMRLSPS